jgi:large subunit ribosomal protein L20
MPRAKGGAKTRQRRKKILKKAKGYVGGRSRLYRTAAETVLRAGVFAYRDRKAKKRLARRLWITRIMLDRKVLAEVAVRDPAAFAKLAETAKAQAR